MSQVSHIYFDEAADFTDEVYDELLDIMHPERKRRRIVRRVFLVIICITVCLGLYWLLMNIATVLWQGSTLIMRLMGWQ